MVTVASCLFRRLKNFEIISHTEKGMQKFNQDFVGQRNVCDKIFMHIWPDFSPEI